MKKISFSLKHLRCGIVIIFIFIVSFPAIYWLIRPGFFPMYDDMQVIRVEQMDKCIKDWQIPCRWVPDLGYGYGYPLFQYYSPLPYYFMEAFYLIGFSFIDSVKIGFIASIYFSALFFYLLSKRFFSNSTSLVITFIWVMIPFRAADVFVRGAMGEAWGMALFPAYLWSFEKFIREKNINSFSLLSLFGGLFLITHNLTTLMGIPLIVTWFLLRLFNNKNLIKYSILSFILSLTIAAFYLVPLIAERNLVHIETTTQGYFNFVNHFSSLKQIFFSTKWGYGPSEVGADDDAFVGIGPLHLLFGFIGFIVYIVSKNKKQLLFFTSLFVMAFLYAFIMHARSSVLWNTLPFMKYFQFPWRFSMVASFIFSLLAGHLFEKTSKYVKPALFMFVITFTFLVYGNYFSPKEWLYINDQDKLTGQMRQRAVTASIYDYLPKSASVNPAEPAPEGLIVESGEVDMISSESGSNWYSFVTDIKSEKADVTIPAYDFPGWQVFVNDQKIKYERSGELGLLSFKLSYGKNIINAKLYKTPLKITSDIISLISLLCIVSLLSIKKLSEKKLT